MRRFPLLFLFFFITACSTPPLSRPVEGQRPRNVIFLIGDGMGISQVTLARLVEGGPSHELTLDRMPVTGLVRTHALNAWVTDSAASATALACGEKTNLFAVGMGPQDQLLDSLLVGAQKKGQSVGLVTSTRITHATPGAFAAHVKLRWMEQPIARHYLAAGVDVLLGGGKRNFPENLLESYRAAGYAVVESKKDLARSEGKVLGLFARSHMPFIVDRGDEPTLPDMARKAIEILSKDPQGFFLMMEGGRIDHACHMNDAPAMVRELVEFDQVVKMAVDFAQKNGETLVVVTADHSTGGLAVTEKAMSLRHRFEEMTASASRIESLWEKGKGAALLKKYARIDSVSPQELKRIDEAKNAKERVLWIGRLISRECGVTFIPMPTRLTKPNSTNGHVGGMVPVYSFGPGAENLTGTMENAELSRRIRMLAGY